jgi:hypothetical protein
VPLAQPFSRPGNRRALPGHQGAWLAKLPSKQWYIWDYYLHGRPGSRGLPVYFPRLIAADLRELKGVSRGDLIETYKHHDMVDYRPTTPEHDYDPLALDHLNIYVTSRLWWDADLDLDALLEEYYELYYGPARAQMKAFIEYSEQNWPGMNRDAEKIGRALELLEAAQAAVGPDTVYGRRVQRVAGYVQPLYALREQLARKRENVPSARVLSVASLARKKLDGRLDDEEYWPVRTLPLVGLEKGDPAPPDRGTWVRVFRAGDALYFGIRCAEPDIAGLAAGEGGDIRAGDFVEILLETSTYSYYRITVNPAGALADADRGEDGVGRALAVGRRGRGARRRWLLERRGARAAGRRRGAGGRPAAGRQRPHAERDLPVVFQRRSPAGAGRQDRALRLLADRRRERGGRKVRRDVVEVGPGGPRVAIRSCSGTHRAAGAGRSVAIRGSRRRS